MLIVRVIGLAVAVALGALVLLYVFTGERKYLGIAWRVLKYALFLVILVLTLFALERLWGML